MRGTELDFSRPRKPTDNADLEGLDGKFRAGMPERPLIHEP
jgi:hypothetical protein